MDVGLLVICNRVGMPVMLIVNVFMQMVFSMGVEMAILFPVKQENSRNFMQRQTSRVPVDAAPRMTIDGGVP